MQYLNGLSDVTELLDMEGAADPVILHTDQGSVYASIAYNELIKDKNIHRSMSRAGKPTDNPVNESLNGWIKEELLLDFRIGACGSREDITKTIDGYVRFYNSQRPCYAIGYDIPDRFYQRFKDGDIERKNTFENRVLTDVPKFVQQRRKAAST